MNPFRYNYRVTLEQLEDRIVLDAGAVDPVEPVPEAPPAEAAAEVAPPVVATEQPALITNVKAAAEDSVIQNPSFETGDYTGWTIEEAAVSTRDYTPFLSWYYGISAVGDEGVIERGAEIYDFSNDRDGMIWTPILPHKFTPTDGDKVALQLTNGPLESKTSQTFVMPENAKTIKWDMEYICSTYPEWCDGFDRNEQFVEVTLTRVEDGKTKTLFKTRPRDDLSTNGMEEFSSKVRKGFRGEEVTLTVHTMVSQFFLDVAYDNFRIELIPTEVEPLSSAALDLLPVDEKELEEIELTEEGPLSTVDELPVVYNLSDLAVDDILALTDSDDEYAYKDKLLTAEETTIY